MGFDDGRNGSVEICPQGLFSSQDLMRMTPPTAKGPFYSGVPRGRQAPEAEDGSEKGRVEVRPGWRLLKDQNRNRAAWTTPKPMAPQTVAPTAAEASAATTREQVFTDGPSRP